MAELGSSGYLWVASQSQPFAALRANVAVSQTDVRHRTGDSMAKNPPPSGRSKVRIFFVDADLAPGDMHELTSALTSAIRPTHMIQRMAPPRLASETSDRNANGDLEIAEDADVEDVNEEPGDEHVSAEGRGPSKPRKYRSPKPVTDLDMNAGGKSFDAFAREKGSPSEHAMRYLVAAAWLAEYAKITTVSVDHVYTCYKSAGWTFDVSDPGFPFRYLKKEGLGDTKGGKFTINHLGSSKVEKMKPSAT
jgi:hypothetical protein